MQQTPWRSILASGLLVLVFLPQSAFAARDPDLFAGDVAQIVIPAAALAMTYYFDDAPGRVEWFKHTGATFLMTEVLKYSLNKTYLGARPNGGDRGFPSGHTSASCGGAFFMGERYGFQYAIPALAAALVTGYSRVDEGFHHWRDVVAGCAIAYTSSRYFVTPGSTRLTVVPLIAPHFAGVHFNSRF